MATGSIRTSLNGDRGARGAGVATLHRRGLGGPRALIVSATPPLPPDNGKRVFMRGLVQYFVERVGAERTHYALVAGPDDELPDLPCHVHRLPKPTSAQQVRTLAWDSVLARRLSLQEAMLSSASLRREVASLVDELRPDVEVYDTVRMAQHAPIGGFGRRVVYLDDLFSRRYDRMLAHHPARGERENPLGEFANNVPRALHRVLQVPAVYRPLLRFERDRMWQRECQVAAQFPGSLLVNDDEAAELSRHAGAPVYVVRPLLPDSRVARRAPATPPEFVFLGRLNVQHNDDAIRAFLREAMPAVLDRIPGVRVRIVGKGATRELTELVERYRGNVTLEGFVPDLGQLFASASAMLAPMRQGTGIKTKLLESLSYGLPVVATSLAVDGIPVEGGRRSGVAVNDRIEGWVDELADVADPAANQRLSVAARAFFDAVYGRDVVTRQYDEFFFPLPA